MENYSKLEIREDLKDYQLARLMYWTPIDAKTNIPKSDLELVKILRKWGVLIERHDEVSIVGYPTRYTNHYSPKEPNDITWLAINTEIMK